LRWFAILLAAAIPCLSLAGDRPAEGTLFVRGTEGALLALDGDSAGVLPVGEIRLPFGKHEILLSKWGHESRGADVWITPHRGETRVYYLHAKTKRDVLWRSLLVPGWGGYYCDRKAQGILTLAVEAGILGYAVHENGLFQDRRDAYEEASLAYRRAVTDEAIAEARAERDAAYGRLEAAETDRNRAYIAAAVLYGLSVIEPLVRFPFAGAADGEPVVIRSGFSERGAEASVALRVEF
jgi:hypothetical protein